MYMKQETFEYRIVYTYAVYVICCMNVSGLIPVQYRNSHIQNGMYIAYTFVYTGFTGLYICFYPKYIHVHPYIRSPDKSLSPQTHIQIYTHIHFLPVHDEFYLRLNVLQLYRLYIVGTECPYFAMHFNKSGHIIFSHDFFVTMTFLQYYYCIVLYIIKS